MPHSPQNKLIFVHISDKEPMQVMEEKLTEIGLENPKWFSYRAIIAGHLPEEKFPLAARLPGVIKAEWAEDAQVSPAAPLTDEELE